MSFLFFLGAGIFLCVVQEISAAPSTAETAVRFLLHNSSCLPRQAVCLLPIFMILVPHNATCSLSRLFLHCLLWPFGLAGLSLAEKDESAARGVALVAAAAAVLSRKPRGGLACFSFLLCLLTRK